MSAQNRAVLHVLLQFPFREAIICLVLGVVVLSGSYAISASTGSRTYFFAGIGAAAILLIWPVWLGTGVFLLWKNPQKYKEKDMKRRRAQNERIRQEN